MLSEPDRKKFLEDGYLVIPDVVPENLCQEVIYTIVNYLKLDLFDPESWYKNDYQGHGIVPLHHPQSLWNIRQHPLVYKVFSDLYQDTNLWVTMDRVSYKPPKSPKTTAWKQPPLHWDCDPWSFKDFRIQGLVYLTDTDESQGAFCCVPSLYQNLQTYLAENKGNDLARRPKVPDEDLVALGGTAGSLLLFNRFMPHSSLGNESDKHRFVQYVSMEPVGDEKIRQQRIKNWQEKLPPEWAIRQKIKEQDIPESGQAAALTPLGRKLVGLDLW